MVGETDIVWPVHANSPFLCVIIQSTVPSRCITTKELIGDLLEMRAAIGLVEDIFWYKNGMPKAAPLKGLRIDKVDRTC